MIRLENINKIYGSNDVETCALKNINLNVDPGEFISIMGPSGCGKSTLLNLLGMLDNPTSGDYFFDKQCISQLPERKIANVRKKNISFIFQNYNLIDELSVLENIELPLLYQKISPRQRKIRITEVLEQMNIAHRANHMPQQLSGGQQQRVAVARALSTKPRVILADEPTGNLDSKNGDNVMELLKSLNDRGTTILMVTHSQYHAEYANRIINLFDGKIITQDANAIVKHYV
ncbi:ABC transporter ATP-binding protein [Colwellia sp. E2M01]|uniref:ABC transporter ATP-binding protein n=1 Tax=Colwellia sp. E2M01 TaxID=2841561 RepID=UPI001C09A4B0|nr:ABC transporter ATP-binding protein [Colwellia sp. E2M01]MBU2871596.1 ABC transporter ATP-binding protein [Colwellia sp. E2M01]